MNINSSTVTSEGNLPTNNAIDPGEMVTVRFSLSNIGTANATNVTVRLLSGNGVLMPSAAQQFATVVNGGAAITPSFSFVASGSCGGAIAPVLQIEEGSNILTRFTVPYQLGQPAVVFAENFDSTIEPAIPAGWTRTVTGAQTEWVTDSGFPDSSPNAAVSGDITAVGTSSLISPAINVPANSCLLTFRNAYDLECDATIPTNGYDGGVLEIQIGTNAYQDILALGGTFVAGGYNRTIAMDFQNELAGRRAWSGRSYGYITTIATLPASALGKSIHLRWCCAMDAGTGGGGWDGWRIDSISLTAGSCSMNTNPPVIQSVTTSNGVATVTWNSVVGRNYRVQYETNVAGFSWTDLVPDVTATNSTASATDPSGASQRFYRVVLLP
jgi:hypothetical protein